MVNGHDAPFVFSAGHNTFLPPGLSIDGDGILKGDDPALLSELEELPLCVRQLDVEMCKKVHVREKTEIREDPVAKPIDNGSGPAKKGMGKGGALLAVGGLALAAGGIAVAASAAQLTEEASTGGGGGMTYLDSQGIVCLYNAGGVLSSCSGNVLVNITGKIAVGSTLRLSGFVWGGNRTISTSPPGSVNFFLTGGTGDGLYDDRADGRATAAGARATARSPSTPIAADARGGTSCRGPLTCPEPAQPQREHVYGHRHPPQEASRSRSSAGSPSPAEAFAAPLSALSSAAGATPCANCRQRVRTASRSPG